LDITVKARVARPFLFLQTTDFFMTVLIWICILVDIAAAVFLLISAFSPDQDAAGRGMIFLPIIILVAMVGFAYMLLQNQQHYWALAVSGVPVIVLIYLAVISFL
jgi:peptidoglycan biosynthesis protein MviN/MurJ (putative lipid II flippase)